MHETQRWRLVCYDIRDPKRYRKAHKLLKGYGEPVQFSIFRCRLDDRQAAELRWHLARILTDEDGLLILDLCPRCAGRVVTCNHKAGWDAPPPTFSVILSGSAKSPEFAQASRPANREVPQDPPATDGKVGL